MSDNRMLTQDKIEKYFDEASTYRRLDQISKNPYIKKTYMEIREAAINLVKVPSNLFLDAGCGVGALAFIYNDIMSNHFENYRMIGIDISHQSLKLASIQNLANARYCRANLRNLPFPDKTFDVIFLVEVIEHISDKELVINEISRVMKDNGQLIVTTPNRDCITLKIHNRLLDLGFRIYKRPIVNKDEYCSMVQIMKLADICGLYPVIKLYLHLNPLALTRRGKTYGIIPIATPRLLLYWLKILRKIEDKIYIPLQIKKYFYWTIVMDFRKQQRFKEK